MDIARIKITNNKETTPIKFPKYPPHKVVEKYYESFLQTSLPKKFPEWDETSNTSSSAVIIAHRDYVTAVQKLAKKRVQSRETRLQFDAQWSDLAEKEDALGRSFRKFNNFVKGNADKRTRAEKRIEEDIAMQEKRDGDIAEMEARCNRIKEIKTMLETNIKEYSKVYDHFLSDVVMYFPEFRSKIEILNRYESLVEVKEELSEKQEENLKQLETARTVLMKMCKAKSLELMGLENTLSDLLHRFKAALSKAKKWELVVAKCKQDILDKMLEHGQVKHTCWRLYRMMYERDQVRDCLEMDNVEGQLLAIKFGIKSLKKVVHRTKTKYADKSQGK